MPSDLFRSSRLKLERVREHRDDIKEYATRFFADRANLPRIGIKRDTTTSEYVINVTQVPNLQAVLDRTAVILGDAAHNLRSALDHLVFSLARASNPGAVVRPDRLQFPITDSSDEFTRQARKRLYEIADCDQEVIERYQAYHRIDDRVSVGPYFHPLQMLRELSNTDKHRMLTIIVIPSSGVSFEDGFGGMALPILVFSFLQRAMAGDLRIVPIAVGVEVARTRLPGISIADAENVGSVLPHLSLPEHGRSIVAVLDKIATVVETIIAEFEKRLSRS